ncbi:hypothetical protein M5K25_005603 [Dendrobium thyrsiflorum]|uniref:Lipoxygenase n=1 Tax=Dendrobium thyrsiflorum TaxID=117978 RepID=A0ABD0VQT3_DENTH
MMRRATKKDKPSSRMDGSRKVIAKVLLMNKNLLQLNDINAAINNKIHDFLGKKVEFLLVSATVGDPSPFSLKKLSYELIYLKLRPASGDVNLCTLFTLSYTDNGNRGVVGPPAYLETVQYSVVPELFACEKTYVVNFIVEESEGIPGAVIVRNRHRHQFYLNSITLENFPGQGRIHFDCKSWVYKTSKYSYDRIFFANNSYLPKHTPEKLRPYRQDELRNLRGDGVNRKLEEWDRVYSYDYYNDLGNPDENPNLARPEFPPVSMLDPKQFGNQNSTIKLEHIERNLDGLSVQQALDHNRLFILDHHDSIVPYLRRINTTESKVYATRTILFLKEDSTLKPLAIELSLPNPDGDTLGVISNVYTPASFGIEGSIWTLAKTYVIINDSCIHELISHWLRTHAVIEPFVIATNRHLSAMHPINKLLVPHYRDTMKINALARQTLVNAGGHLESLLFPSKYALEMSATVYKSWNFIEQGLPFDLLKRGMAVEDPSRPHKLRLLIEDYPYAVDGLAIWSAIETWVSEYCAIYYQNDSTVRCDEELQAWWKEVLEVGHGDKKDEPWWPKMRSVPELVNSCSTIIWVASAMHAAVNFGQYSYAGYMPNRPTMSRQFMPEIGSAEYEELQKNPEKVFLKTITCKQTVIIEMIWLIETLSTHSSDEVYLGQRVSAEWARDERAINALNRFRARLKEIEKMIAELNSDPTLKNRNGPVKMPYTLLSPYSDSGITGKGIPNSISL